MGRFVKIVIGISLFTITAFSFWSILEILWLYLTLSPISSIINNDNIFSPKDLYSFRLLASWNETKIPRIIHQTWRTNDLTTYPNYNSHELWGILYLIKGYEIKLWTDQDILTLITTHYPHYYAAYHALPYDIQRADFGRYLILYHEGGYYADLDTFPNIYPLEDFAAYDLVVPYATDGRTVSNHFICAAKGSPVLFTVLAGINSTSNDCHLNSPYFQVFATSGPFYLQRKLADYFGKERFIRNKAEDIERVLFLPSSISKKYFYHIAGRSWLLLDGIIINWIGDYPFLFSFWILFAIGLFNFRKRINRLLCSVSSVIISLKKKEEVVVPSQLFEKAV